MTLLDDGPGSSTTGWRDRLDVPPAPIRRTPTPLERRSARTKEHKKRLIAEWNARNEAEALILNAAAGGHSFRSIAGQLSMSESGVKRIFRQALERRPAEGVEAFRVRQLSRLEELLKPVWREAQAGNQSAATNVLRVCHQMNQLMNAYPPAEAKVDVSGRVEHVELDAFAAAVLEMERELEARDKALSPPPT